MPRRAAHVQPNVPLFLVPHMIHKGIQKFGVEVERIIVRKVGRHYYNISIHSRSIKRELQKAPPRTGMPAACAVDQEGIG